MTAEQHTSTEGVRGVRREERWGEDEVQGRFWEVRGVTFCCSESPKGSRQRVGGGTVKSRQA